MLVLHLKYILNKYNLITLLLIILFYLVSLIVNIISIPKDLTQELLRDTYFYNVTLILKLVVIILIVFIISLSSTTYQESYQLFIINNRTKRISFFLSKILVLFLITILIILVFLGLFVLVGLIGSKWFIIEFKHIKFFTYLALDSFMYGMFTYCLIKFLNNLIVVIIPCFIVIFQEAFSSLKIVKYLTYFFPIIENGVEPSLSYGIIHVIMLILCYIGIVLIKSYIIDIK